MQRPPGPGDPDALLAAYDTQLREEAEVARATSWQRHGPLLWAVFDGQGMTTYRDLGGARGQELDALIEATLAHFRAVASVDTLEWKTRGHDAPADLGERLMSHGFVPEEVETVMIGLADALAVEVEIPPDVTLRRAGDGGALLEDVQRASAMQAQVFGRGAGRDAQRVAEQLAADPEHLQLWMAESAGLVVAAGTLDIVDGTEFAGLWGGAVLPEWRGRGIYRGLVAVRARAAVDRGVRYMHSDCSSMSRPILQRSGLVAVTTTTPYVWSPPA